MAGPSRGERLAKFEYVAEAYRADPEAGYMAAIELGTRAYKKTVGEAAARTRRTITEVVGNPDTGTFSDLDRDWLDAQIDKVAQRTGPSGNRLPVRPAPTTRPGAPGRVSYVSPQGAGTVSTTPLDQLSNVELAAASLERLGSWAASRN